MPIGNNHLISVNELANYDFSIPWYQRGYRWKKEQIMALLEDVHSFHKSEDGDFYCLQPLVVNKHDKGGEEKWNLVDGQQRLTTIHLTLRILGCEGLKLSYERDDLIKGLDIKQRDPDYNSPEAFYLTTAVITIRKWFEKLGVEDTARFVECLQNDVKFIWHNIGKENDRVAEHDYFRNLNSGKIELTTSELIKGLFLGSPDNGVVGRDTWQHIVSEEFNEMEQWLRNPEVWYFLSGGEPLQSTCIDLLFNLLADCQKLPFSRFDLKRGDSVNSHEEKRAFFLISHMLNGDTRIRQTPNEVFEQARKCWKLVREIFLLLQSWYSDCDNYNLIGFIRSSVKTGQSLCNIVDWYYGSKSKTDFKGKLFQKAFDIPGVDVQEAIDCKTKLVGINGSDDEFLDSKEDPRTRAFLLLVNIIPLLLETNTDQKTRFPFAVFHQLSWDVEHIVPRHRRDIQEAFAKLPEDQRGRYPDDLRRLLEGNRPFDENNEIYRRYFLDTPDCLENYTLLSDHVNRGIGDQFFSEKRRLVRDYYRGGHYVPPSSLEVFMKFDTDQPEEMLFWSDSDRKAYIKRLTDLMQLMSNYNKELCREVEQ